MAVEVHGHGDLAVAQDRHGHPQVDVQGDEERRVRRVACTGMTGTSAFAARAWKKLWKVPRVDRRAIPPGVRRSDETGV